MQDFGENVGLVLIKLNIFQIIVLLKLFENNFVETVNFIFCIQTWKWANILNRMTFKMKIGLFKIYNFVLFCTWIYSRAFLSLLKCFQTQTAKRIVLMWLLKQRIYFKCNYMLR